MEKMDLEEAIKSINSQNKWDKRWLKMYTYACKYYQKYGNLLIPARHLAVEDGEIYHIGDWIDNQRKAYIRHELRQDRVGLLELIGMSWKPNVDRWEEMYQYAKAYSEEHGNLLVHKDYVVKKETNEINLGDWISTQRYKYKRNSISQERIERLEAIGMVWDANINKWEESYECAKAYYEEFGSLVVPRQFTVKVEGKEIRLGTWINTQRIDYHEGSMSKERIDRLEKIGMKWRIKPQKQEDKKLYIKK